MIKTYLIITLLFISLYNYSQENKHKVMVNGNLNYIAHKNRPSKVSHSTFSNSTGTVDLNIGYFLTKNFVIGISGSYQKELSHLEYVSIKNTAEVFYSSGIFTRYNCMTKNGKFGFFFQLNSNLYLNKLRVNWIEVDNNTTVTSEETEKTNGINTIFTPGIIYFLNHRFSVEASLMNSMFDSFNTKDGLGNHGSNSNFSTNFSPSTFYLGFSYYFGGKENEAVKEGQ